MVHPTISAYLLLAQDRDSLRDQGQQDNENQHPTNSLLSSSIKLPNYSYNAYVPQGNIFHNPCPDASGSRLSQGWRKVSSESTPNGGTIRPFGQVGTYQRRSCVYQEEVLYSCYYVLCVLDRIEQSRKWKEKDSIYKRYHSRRDSGMR